MISLVMNTMLSITDKNVALNIFDEPGALVLEWLTIVNEIASANKIDMMYIAAFILDLLFIGRIALLKTQ